MQYLGTIDKAKDIINKDFVEKLLGDYQPLINESSKLPYSLISGVPTSLPASDVYPWAKASTKPSYSYSEIAGAISTTELQNYLTSNSYLNVTSGDNRYLQLSGGTLTSTLTISTGNDKKLILNNTDSDTNFSRIDFQQNGVSVGQLGIQSVGTTFLSWTGDGGNHRLLHAGNIGSYNAGSATKLQTARTIWGQSFDGTGNVSGVISNTHTIEFDTSLGATNIGYLWTNTRGMHMDMSGLGTEQQGTNLTLTPTGNVGIGTASPISKCDIYGLLTVRTESSTSKQSSLNLMNTSSDLWQLSARYGTSDNGNFNIYYYNGSTWVNPISINKNGNLLVTGGITMYSDQRKKTILNHVELSLKQIANAPLIEHYYNSDDKKTTHVGSIAQYWAAMNDWFCKLDSEGFYTMEIQNAALASAISIARELDRYEIKTDKAIKKLKKRIYELEEELERLKSA